MYAYIYIYIYIYIYVHTYVWLPGEGGDAAAVVPGLGDLDCTI